MFKVTYKSPIEKLSFFRWFKQECKAINFMLSVGDKFERLEKL